MQITLAHPRGFCSGVRRALHMLSGLMENPRSPVCVYHEIVHNKTIVTQFEQQGVRFVNSLDQVPSQATLLFSAHGVAPELRTEAQKRGLTVIDATCPLVQQLHNLARSFADQGFHIILIGYPHHDEVVGTLGEAPEQMSLVSSLDDVQKLQPPQATPLVCLMQTTLLESFSKSMLDALTTRFPELLVPHHCGICHATQEHQDAIRNLDFIPDLVLVVGSATSSNSQRLVEVAREKGASALLIDSPDEIPVSNLLGNEHILITAGASAPENIVQACVSRLRLAFPNAVLNPDSTRNL